MTYLEQFISHASLNEPVVQSRVEHFVFTAEREFICVTTDCLWVFRGQALTILLLGTRAALLKHFQGIQNQAVAVGSLPVEGDSLIVVRTASVPVL